ncbi:Lung seven transmembrane receptor [Heracleum sosnowskyi]|uniref:Lung seven transmembrane receptor n=1 Tax=Heracleum sosnowskyi TaxID=360622 RepID=A0AAD8M542_9APIA|nr:Lung seven transmembrane receptor [Heracleum sosnowskyi]
MTHFQFPIFLFIFFIASSIPFTLGEIRVTQIRSDNRLTIPFDEFGFTHSGRLDLNVSHIKLSNSQIPKSELSQVGFFLTTRESWLHVIDQLIEREITCSLNSNLIKPVFKFDNLGGDRVDVSFEANDANQYTLVFANCVPNLKVSMNVMSSMYNVEVKTGQKVYLSAGKTSLPSIYFVFFLLYISLAGFWIYTIYSKILSVFRIHFFMLAVVVLKALNLLCETEDKSYIKRTGTAHGWDVLFYIFSFLKGITLFTLIVLIGTGWSFIKPYLQGKEKKVLMIVIPLQVIANVAQIVIDETGPFGEDSYTWKKVFLLVDIVCCCAVLFPIVWSIKNLREAARTDGKAAVNLMKLTLFRQYYVVVICYIYFTRVVVYALETITSYRPKAHNPYFAIDDEEEEAASEALKMEEEFEL